jgi:SAM-dependent methyltransferase
MPLEVKCPICASRSHPDFIKYDFWIYSCDSCQHRFTDIPRSPQHTAEVYADGYFFEGGSGYQDYTKEADLLIAHGERYATLLREFTRPGRLLDIGSAAGFILKGLTQQGWEGNGLEPNARMAAYAREQLQMNVETGTFEQYRPEQKVDLVTMIQVIAHFYDVRRALEITQDLVVKDGFLLVETWDRTSLPARLLGHNWHHYSPPSVVNWFSAQGLRSLMQQFGFEEIARGRPSKWISGSHAKSLLGYKLAGIKGGSLLRRALDIMPDRLRIPYPSLDLFWALYRKRH